MILAAILLAVAAGGIQTKPEAIAQPTAARTIILSAGTPVRLTTTATIDSRSIIQGQRFGLTVADDVLVGSRLVIPRGSLAVGEVESLSGKGMFGKAAKFALTPLFIEIDGQRLNLTGSRAQSGGNGVAAAAVTTALIGALGLFITGKSATLPPGSVILGAIRIDVSIRPASLAKPPPHSDEK